MPGYTVYYSDTDSIVLNRPLPNSFVGNELGQMKLEHLVLKGVFLGPKFYAINSIPKGFIIKVRGLSEIHFTIDHMISLLTDSSFLTSQTIWQRDIHAGLITLREQLFTLISSETKRLNIRDSNGRIIDTVPHILVDGIIITASVQTYNYALVPYSQPPMDLIIYSQTSMYLIPYYQHSVALIVYSVQPMALVIYSAPPIILVLYSVPPIALILYSIHPMALITLEKYLAPNLMSSSIFNYILGILYLSRLLLYNIYIGILFHISELDGVTGALVYVMISFILIFYFFY